MKLLSLHIENFGKLQNYTHVFSEGLNIIQSENGWGKTTLAAFIKAMFYGMDKKGNNKAYVADRSRFLPWQGGIYGGSLIFEVNGKTYRIYRTFAQTPEGDRFELLNIDTNKFSRDFSSNIGEEIFGVGQQTFSMTTFFTQKGLESSLNDEMRSYLTGANDHQDDLSNYSKGILKLDKALKNFKLSCPTPSQLRYANDTLSDLNASLNSVEKDKSNWEHELQIKRQQFEEFEELSSSGADEKSLAQISTKISKNSHELQKNDEMLKACKKQHMKLHIFVSLCLIGLLGAAAFLIFSSVNFSVTLFSVSISLVGIMAALFLVVIVKAIKARKKSDLKMLEKQREQLTKEGKILQADLESVALKNEKSLSSLEKKSGLKSEIVILTMQLKAAKEEGERLLEKIDLLSNDMSLMQEKKLLLEKKIMILEQTKLFLQQAKENVSTRFVRPMQQKLDQILKRINNTSELKIDTDLQVKMDTFAGVKEKEFLSSGKQDLVDICKRFALIESIFSEKPFIILDDPFVNLDESTVIKMLEFIKFLSSEYQIIYLVCHSARV